METASQATPELAVAGWTNLLSGLQARHPGMWIGLGNLESRILAERLRAVRIDKPIYISGLARSGTTILLELLSRHPHLSTHRYRDFPPVLAPWFWNWFVDRAGGRQQEASERAHGDRIEVTPESPEAFEEVIWMAFFSKLHDPDTNAALTTEASNPRFEKFYREHIQKMLLLRGGRRYLSKANYNLTRLPYLLKLFPDARFIVVFRDATWHVASLMRQHERFSREHKRDIRLKRHMSRSGHFEFGLDRRPINCGDTRVSRQIRELWSEGRDVEGWALYWSELYGYVADTLEENDALRGATAVVNYESLCAEPTRVMRAVISHCELPPTGEDLAALAGDIIRPPSYYRPDFSEQQAARIESTTGAVRRRLDAMAVPGAGI